MEHTQPCPRRHWWSERCQERCWYRGPPTHGLHTSWFWIPTSGSTTLLDDSVLRWDNTLPRCCIWRRARLHRPPWASWLSSTWWWTDFAHCGSKVQKFIFKWVIYLSCVKSFNIFILLHYYSHYFTKKKTGRLAFKNFWKRSSKVPASVFLQWIL